MHAKGDRKVQKDPIYIVKRRIHGGDSMSKLYRSVYFYLRGERTLNTGKFKLKIKLHAVNYFCGIDVLK